jgi:hypothetical protein
MTIPGQAQSKDGFVIANGVFYAINEAAVVLKGIKDPNQVKEMVRAVTMV